MGLKLKNQLELERCPHCQVDKPTLKNLWNVKTDAHSGGNNRHWKVYVCERCGGLVLAASRSDDLSMSEMYPAGITVDESVPLMAKDYLHQAINSLHAPAGAVIETFDALVN